MEMEWRHSQRLRNDLSKFKTVGFFDERALIIRHIRDFFETVNARQIRACIMFGTLLGKLRHNDFVPWTLSFSTSMLSWANAYQSSSDRDTPFRPMSGTARERDAASSVRTA